MTTEQKHTKGPWRVGNPESDGGAGAHCVIAWHESSPYVIMQSNQNFYEDAKANARRIVACVNFCEGVENGALLIGRASNLINNMDSFAEERDTLAARVKELEAQRDELIGLIQYVNRCLSDGIVVNEAIAKIESGKASIKCETCNDYGVIGNHAPDGSFDAVHCPDCWSSTKIEAEKSL